MSVGDWAGTRPLYSGVPTCWCLGLFSLGARFPQGQSPAGRDSRGGGGPAQCTDRFTWTAALRLLRVEGCSRGRASGCSCSTTCASTGCVAPAPPPPQHRVSCLTARRSPPARLSRPAELLSLPAAVSLRPCPCAFTPFLFLPAGLGRADRAVHCTHHAELTQRRPVSISQSVATLPTSSVMVCTAHSSGPAGRSFPGPREGAHCSTQWPCGGPAGTLGCH